MFGYTCCLRVRRNFSKPTNLDEDDFVMSNLPSGTEAAQVFSGAIKELSTVRFVMVRLQDAVPMLEVVERQIPVRFLFVILGPPMSSIDYHEIGRAIAVCVSNQVNLIKI